jgi:hypothetical protein
VVLSRHPILQRSGPGRKGPAFFAYSDNYLIDVKFGVIVDVEAYRAIRPAEVGAAKTMIEQTEERFGLKPDRLAADTAYGAAPMLNWLVEEKGIAPHFPVNDKSKRERWHLLARRPGLPAFTRRGDAWSSLMGMMYFEDSPASLGIAGLVIRPHHS